MPRDLSLEPTVHTSRSWAVNCMAASPWAPVVAVGGQHQVLLYDPENLALLGIVPWTDGEPCVAKFSRNGKTLLVGGGVAAKSGKVSLWDITTGKHVTDVGDEFDAVLAADISADQTSIALGGPSKTLKLYSTQDGSAIAAVKKHTDWITAIAFSPDGVLLASADRAGGMWVWESKTAREFYNLAGHKAGITAVAFRDDSNVLASASEDGTIKLWDMATGKACQELQCTSPWRHFCFLHRMTGASSRAAGTKSSHIWKPDGSGLATSAAFPILPSTPHSMAMASESSPATGAARSAFSTRKPPNPSATSPPIPPPSPAPGSADHDLAERKRRSTRNRRHSTPLPGGSRK